MLVGGSGQRRSILGGLVWVTMMNGGQAGEMRSKTRSKSNDDGDDVVLRGSNGANEARSWASMVEPVVVMVRATS